MKLHAPYGSRLQRAELLSRSASPSLKAQRQSSSCFLQGKKKSNKKNHKTTAAQQTQRSATRAPQAAEGNPGLGVSPGRWPSRGAGGRVATPHIGLASPALTVLLSGLLLPWWCQPAARIAAVSISELKRSRWSPVCGLFTQRTRRAAGALRSCAQPEA